MKAFGWVVAILAIAAALTGAVLVAMGKIVLPARKPASSGVGGGSTASPTPASGSPSGGQVAAGGTAKSGTAAPGKLGKLSLAKLLVAHLPAAAQQPAQQLLDTADQSAIDALNAEAQEEGWA